MSDDLRHRTSLQVRFRDIDAFGHVNNAVVFSYVEQARIRYLLEVLAWETTFDEMPVILAHVELDYRSPILFGEEVVVESWVEHISRSSLGMSHRVMAGPEARLAGEVRTVLVTYDYATSRSMPVPDDWRARIGDHEGRTFDTDARPAAAAAPS